MCSACVCKAIDANQCIDRIEGDVKELQMPSIRIRQTLKSVTQQD